MTQQEVIKLMQNSTSENDWNNNCDKVKAAHNGQYPTYWYAAIILSGVFNSTKNKW